LGDQQPIEGIAVMRGQGRQAFRVGNRNRKLVEPGGTGGISDQAEVRRDLAEGRLDGDLPGAGCTAISDKRLPT